jgi:hypothetical protein
MNTTENTTAPTASALVPTTPTQALVPAPAGLAVPPTREEAEATARHMAETYEATVAEVTALAAQMQDAVSRLWGAFKNDSEHHYNPFDLDLYSGGCHVDLRRPDSIFKRWKKEAWRVLINRLGVKSVMSVADRHKFEYELEHGELPEVTPEAILSVIFGLVDQAKSFAEKAAKEVFEHLRPSHPHFGGQYKTNSAFKVGRKVILCHHVNKSWGGFQVNYHHEQHLTAIEGVFRLLDGKGALKDGKADLVKAIQASKDGKGETDYFRFKCFKNNNLHLEFKRLDLVKQLNFFGAGEAVLGEDPKE